jgi:hypothetical protein
LRRTVLSEVVRKMKIQEPRRFSMLSFLPLALCLVAAVFLSAGMTMGQERAALVTTASPARVDVSGKLADCRIIYLGFVGALEPAENKYSGVVQLRKLLQGPQFADVCAKTYSPYVWTQGRDWLLTHFPAHGGALTPDELARVPKVVLVGHSMGGWAMLSVARELRSREIPVELTVQVDSVGITDFTIPRNVKAGAIFHANDVLMFMTTKNVRLEDPGETRMVANVLVKHAGHQSITRDPRIRDLVLQTIEELQAAEVPVGGESAKVENIK